MRKLAVIMAMTLVLCGAFALSAQANNPTLEFNINLATPGTIQYFAGSVLNGTGIQVDTVTGFDAPANAGVAFALSNATLDFETGSVILPSNPGELDFNTGNGFVHIHGGLPAAGIADNTFLGIAGSRD